VFDIKSWPVGAAKSYVGHSLAPASADQVMAVLGQFAYGWMPAIKNVDAVAGDVYARRLQFVLQNLEFGKGEIDVAFINSKGFGGNNASASILSPEVVFKMLEKRYGADKLVSYQVKRNNAVERSQDYEKSVSRGDWRVRYRFGEDMINEDELDINQQRLKVPGFKQAIVLPSETIYKDMI
jgi:acetoacetyl-[acyl-carrier protein] synthase